MIEWTLVEAFDWDDGNARKSDKHGVSQAEAEQEARLHALGRTDEGRQLHITFTLRGAATRIRVISARDRSRKERARYAQEG